LVQSAWIYEKALKELAKILHTHLEEHRKIERSIQIKIEFLMDTMKSQKEHLDMLSSYVQSM
jgi:hypothetical protein